MNFHNVAFFKSAAASQDLVADGLPQIVFSGRSNVGKSSVINVLLGRKNLARVSSSPGKTIHINYFLIDESAYFVDLPGYGYAKVPKSERDRWSRLMGTYFSQAAHIAIGILIVDARHAPTGDDLTMAQWFKSMDCPLIVAANKIDKVKNSEKEHCVSRIAETMDLPPGTQVIPFSAQKGTGKETLITKILDAI